ncbi:MAG: hypothetical protein M3Z74_04385 [Pseudomonadota bacterium]|nr:hypothetical protein [Pseudomonadota bacterium]
MNRYEPLIPRVAFGIAAIAMTAITIGVSVIMPTKMDPDSREPRMLEALTVIAPTSTGNATAPESIDVVAVHKAGLSAVPCISPQPDRKPEES